MYLEWLQTSQNHQTNSLWIYDAQQLGHDTQQLGHDVGTGSMLFSGAWF